MKPITIIGGGLAGLTLGIGLRQRGVPVVVWEVGRYPRHRVCGEFISGRGQETLKRLGLFATLCEAGALPAQTASFFAAARGGPVLRLPEPALALSRFVLDAVLAAKFEKLGGELHTGSHRSDAGYGVGVVRASGRRREGAGDGWRWYGVKGHAVGVELVADLEMHLRKDAYVGLCRLPDGNTNICGLFRSKRGILDRPVERMSEAQPSGRGAEAKDVQIVNPLQPATASGVGARLIETLRGPSGTVLWERLEAAGFDQGSLCAVGGLRPAGSRVLKSEECCIGDALGMIPPVTGNGMSLAFESAELALEPITAYAVGGVSWEVACRAVAEECETAFARRLKWGARLQRILLSLPAQGEILALAMRSGFCWRFFFRATR